MMEGSMGARPDGALGNVPLFRGLLEGELHVIATCLRDLRVPKAGVTLFDVGDTSDGAYILREGALAVELPLEVGGVAQLARLGPGTVVGEPCLVQDVPRSLRVRTLQPSKLWVLDRAQFARLRASGDAAAFKVLRNACTLACDRLRSTHQFIDSELRGERWTAVTEVVEARSARGFFGRLFARAR
jgi:CRP-like cAMP-binding protein